MATNLTHTLTKFDPLDKQNLNYLERKTQLEQRKYKRPLNRDEKFERYCLGFICLFAFYLVIHIAFALVMGRF